MTSTYATNASLAPNVFNTSANAYNAAVNSMMLNANPLGLPAVGARYNAPVNATNIGAVNPSPAMAGQRVNPFFLGSTIRSVGAQSAGNPLGVSPIEGTAAINRGANRVNATAIDSPNATAGNIAGSMNAFANPYRAQVLDNALSRIADQRGVAMNEIQGAAAAGGAFGGARHALLEAEAMDRFNQNENETIARLLQQGFDSQAQLGAQQAGLNQQVSLANQANRVQTRLANQQTNLQGQLANQDASLRAMLANQAATNQFGLANQSANLQAQLANQQTGAQLGIADQEAFLRAGLANQSTALQGGLANQSAFMQAQLANQQNQRATNLANLEARLRAGLSNQGTATQISLANQGAQNQALGQLSREQLQAQMANQSAFLQQQQLAQSAAGGLLNASSLGYDLGMGSLQGMERQGDQLQAFNQNIIDRANDNVNAYANYPTSQLGAVMGALQGNPLSVATNTRTQYNPGLFDYLSMGTGVLGVGK